MPAPTVICDICNQNVLKSRTSHIGNGKRACKIHEAVADMATKAAESVKSIHEVGRHHKKRPLIESTGPEFSLVPHCAVCNMLGLRQDDWLSRLLINQAKYELVYGAPNPFDAEEMQKAAGDLRGVPCLWFVAWKGNNTKIRLSHDAYQVATLLGFTLICSSCCIKHGVSRQGDDSI